MAQFGHSVYGTSYYGATNAIYGLFTSEVITVPVAIQQDLVFDSVIRLPNVTYTADKEFVYAGEWTKNGTSMSTASGSATILFSAWGFNLHTEGSGTYTLKKLINGELVVDSTGDLPVNKPNIEYAQYELTISGAVTIHDIEIKTCYVNIYGRSTGDWVKLPISDMVLATEDDVAGLYEEARVLDDYTYKVRYSGNFGISHTSYQFKIEMITSDNNTAPIVRYLLIQSGGIHSGYTDSGTYTVTFDFGPTFKSYETIEWDSTEDPNTSLTITSQSGTGTSWGILSLPYVHDMTQVRLLDNATQGWIKLPVINPRHLKEWDSFNISAFSRKDSNAISPIRAEFYDSSDHLITTIPEPYSTNKISHAKYNGTAVPMYVRLILARPGLQYNSPCINNIELTATCEYTQVHHESSSISRVFGPKEVISLSALNFTDKPEPEYGLIDYTIRVHSTKDIVLYWKSEESSPFRDLTISTLSDDILCAISNEPYYINYGLKRIYYDGQPTTTTERMTNTFMNPYHIFNTTLKYMYKVVNGWADYDGHILDSTSTDRLVLSFTEAIEGRPELTSESEVNGTYNSYIEFVYAWPNATDYAEWISKEYVSDEIPVNPNGLYIPYTYDRQPLPDIDDFAYVDNNCYVIEVIPGSVTRNGIHVDQQFHTSLELVYPDNVYINGIPKREYIIQDVIIRGTDITDRLRYPQIEELIGIYNNPQTGYPISKANADYHLNADYLFDAASCSIDWSPDGIQPEEGAIYYVYYVCRKPLYARIQISCDYTETKTTHNGAWRSATNYQYQASCAPDQDYISNDLTNIIPMTREYWPDLGNATDLHYIVHDDNPWVSTSVQNNRVVGTLGKYRPATDWYPKIKPGYYYIGKDEFYLYADPVTIHADNIERAGNVSYEDGILIENASTNLLLNSDFSIQERRLIYQFAGEPIEYGETAPIIFEVQS